MPLDTPQATQVGQEASATSWSDGRTQDALCRALKDPNPAVRADAARELACVGDASAVEPLVEALRHATGGPATVWVASTAMMVLIGLAALVVVGAFYVSPWLGWVSLLACGVRCREQRRRLGELRAALALALAAITERQPCAEACNALPELRALSADLVAQDERARRTCEAAVRRIEAVTDDLRDLPIVAHSPAQAFDTLPLPAAPAEAAPGDLPRV